MIKVMPQLWMGRSWATVSCPVCKQSGSAARCAHSPSASKPTTPWRVADLFPRALLQLPWIIFDCVWRRWQGTNALCHFIDRTDAWTPATGAISNCGYSAAGALTGGTLSISTNPAPASNTSFLATQNAANATVTVAVPLAGGGTLHTETIIARAENVLIISLWTSGTTRTIEANASVAKLPNGERRGKTKRLRFFSAV